MKTIKDIAKEAKCSISTVSKALNDRPDVSKKTKERILEIVEKYNFYPNAYGKGLKRKLTENIGVIFCRESRPLSQNPFYSRVLEGIEAELAINNYNLVLHFLSVEGKVDIPKMILEKQVDGLILVGIITKEFINKIKDIHIPSIFIDPKFPINNFSQVLIDNEYGAYLATQHLIQMGHERIGFISGALDRLSFKLRYDGYVRALKFYKCKFDPDLIKASGLEEGYTHVSELLDLKNPPTAIFSTNDINAIYGYKAIKERNLRIPEDISIIGFDDIEFARMSSPPLTTIRVYKEELGSIAVRNLLQSLHENIHAHSTTIVPIKLIIRESISKK